MENKVKANLDALRIDPGMKNNRVKKNWKAIIAVSVLVFIIAAALMIIVKNKPLEVETITVTASENNQDTAVLTASGYVEPRRKATIAAKITGQIKELYVEEGMRVEKDQVLARLDDAEAQARYEANLAEYEVAKAAVADLQVNLENSLKSLKRRKELFKEKWISQEELDNAETAVESFKARLNLAKEQVTSARARVRVSKEDLENCTIRAPFPGIAISKDAQVGEMVSPISAGGGYTRTGISTIVDMNSLEIEVDVNESYIAKVTVGQQVTAAPDAYPDWKIPARVRTIIPAADRQKATVKVRIAFDKLDRKILPDMGIKVFFLSAETTNKEGPVIIIPASSLFEEDKKTYVYLIKNGAVEKRAVLIGSTFKNGVTIMAGLSPGDRLAADGNLKLTDGQPVKVKK